MGFSPAWAGEIAEGNTTGVLGCAGTADVTGVDVGVSLSGLTTGGVTTGCGAGAASSDGAGVSTGCGAGAATSSDGAGVSASGVVTAGATAAGVVAGLVGEKRPNAIIPRPKRNKAAGINLLTILFMASDL